MLARLVVDGLPVELKAPGKGGAVEVKREPHGLSVRRHGLEGDDAASERERKQRVPAKVGSYVHHQAAASRRTARARLVDEEARELGLDQKPVACMKAVEVEGVVDELELWARRRSQRLCQRERSQRDRDAVFCQCERRAERVQGLRQEYLPSCIPVGDVHVPLGPFVQNAQAQHIGLAHRSCTSCRWL